MIFLGIDDTDIIGSPGTNQLARAIVARLGDTARDSMICRHQLLFDPRIPYTSKNGSASLLLPHAVPDGQEAILDIVRAVMIAWFVEGSDPGLCAASVVPEQIRAFGRRVQTDVVTQDEARAAAVSAGCHLEGLGGTRQGVIGALAAVGLAAGGDDGRVVHLATWPYPDECSGPQPVEKVFGRGIDEIRQVGSGARVVSGIVDIGKHLRPSLRGGKVVLFVEQAEPGAQADWRAVKLP